MLPESNAILPDPTTGCTLGTVGPFCAVGIKIAIVHGRFIHATKRPVGVTLQVLASQQ